MRLSWNKCFLGDVITLKRGYDLPAKDRVSGIYPVVSSSGVTGTHNQARAKGPGIVTGRYGTLGEVFYVSSDFWPLNTSLYISDFKGNDPRFAGYLLWSLGLKRNNAAGAVPGLNRNHLHRLEICFPPLPIQRRIASVLSAYDDLIENNRRRIAILEEMARRLYEEWFVRFRFPGHEHVPFIETEQGRIPEGWEVKGLYDVAEVSYGHPFKSRRFNDDGNGLGVVRIRDIKGNTTKTYTEERGKPEHRIKNGDILIGMDGIFHMGKWAGGEAWLNQRVVRLRPVKGVPTYLLFLAIKKPIQNLEQTIIGTTVAHLSAKDLKATQFLMPPRRLLDQISLVLDPVYDLELRLWKKNTNLRAQRDLLLPKLVSGEIDISNAEKTWGEAA